MALTSTISEWIRAEEFPSTEDFFDTLAPDGQRFTEEEGHFWDFKDAWPHSYSDGFWGGIARAICGFSNASGGFLIFGVHDKKRTGGHNKVIINTDRLKSAFKQLTGYDFLCQTMNYEHPVIGTVTVLMIPKRENYQIPIRFNQKLDKYLPGDLWIRDGHEVVRVAPKHFPIIFCRSEPLISDDIDSDISGSLPPSPTTIRKFVGRSEVLDQLFEWLATSDEPRKFLYGGGGSGKTAIAYEFAKLIHEHGRNVYIGGSKAIDQIIFLSAKEKQIITSTAKIEDIIDPDFSNFDDLMRKILTNSGWTNANIQELSSNELKSSIKELFDFQTLLLVIDDVDTLTTKGIDPGFDFLFSVLSRCKSESKILYTLRNAPTHSISNSIEVPGLSLNGEYESFVEECSKQFKQEPPKPSFRDQKLRDISDCRPLVIESVIALRRSTGSYDLAAKLFEEKVGVDIRDYIFSREWDALSKDPLAKLLLVALAELNRPANHEDLKTILRAEESRIIDAIGEVREMFLICHKMDEDAYSLAPLTRKFILGKRATTDMAGTVRERVSHYNRFIQTASPDVLRIIGKVDRMIGNKHEALKGEIASELWQLVTDSTLSVAIVEDPIFRGVRGYVACSIQNPRLSEAREDFRYAVEMRHDPEFFRIKKWMSAEKEHDEFGTGIDQAYELVINGRRYSLDEKTTMMQKWSSAKFFKGLSKKTTDPVDAISEFSSSLNTQLKIYRINVDEGHHWISSTLENSRKSCHNLFDTIFAIFGPVEVLDEITRLLNLRDIFLDPIAIPTRQIFERIKRQPMPVELRHKIRNKLRLLDQLATKTVFWCEPNIKSQFKNDINMLEQYIT